MSATPSLIVVLAHDHPCHVARPRWLSTFYDRGFDLAIVVCHVASSRAAPFPFNRSFAYDRDHLRLLLSCLIAPSIVVPLLMFMSSFWLNLLALAPV